MRKANVNRIDCAAHKLNLVVNHSLKSTAGADELILRIHELAKFYTSSCRIKKRLAKVAVECGKQALTMIVVCVFCTCD